MPTFRTALRFGALLSLSLILIGDAHAKKKKKKKPKPRPWSAVGPKKGKSVIDVLVEANLAEDQAFKPFSIAPDYKYGVTKQFSVGAIHSGYATTGFYGGAGNGLCLTSDSCAGVYNNFGAEGVFKFPIDGPTTLGGTFGLVTSGFGDDVDDNGASFLKLGVKGRYMDKPVMFWWQPHLMMAMTNTDFISHALLVPASIGFMAGDGFIPFLQTGFALDLGGESDVNGVTFEKQNPYVFSRDNLAIPLTIGAHYKTERTMWVGAMFTAHNIGAQADGPLDSRALNLNWGMMF